MKHKAFFFLAIMFSSIYAYSLDDQYLQTTLYLGSSFKSKGQSIEARKDELRKIEQFLDQEMIKSPESSRISYYKYRVIMEHKYLLSKSDPKGKEIVENASEWSKKLINQDPGDLTVPQLFQITNMGGIYTVYAVDTLLEFTNVEIETRRGNEFEFLEKHRVAIWRQKIRELIKIGRFSEAKNAMKELNEQHPRYISRDWDDSFIVMIEQSKLKH
jgi:tetratricopeptide (TPR) repeat protein